jgi:hypothetical protein
MYKMWLYVLQAACSHKKKWNASTSPPLTDSSVLPSGTCIISCRKTAWNSTSIPRSLYILMQNNNSPKDHIHSVIHLFSQSVNHLFGPGMAQLGTRPQAGWPRDCVSVPKGSREFSLLHRVHGAYPVFWPVGTSCWCARVKQQGHDVFEPVLVLRLRMHGTVPAFSWMSSWHKYFGILNAGVICE